MATMVMAPARMWTHCNTQEPHSLSATPSRNARAGKLDRQGLFGMLCVLWPHRYWEFGGEGLKSTGNALPQPTQHFPHPSLGRFSLQRMGRGLPPSQSTQGFRKSRVDGWGPCADDGFPKSQKCGSGEPLILGLLGSAMSHILLRPTLEWNYS